MPTPKKTEAEKAAETKAAEEAKAKENQGNGSETPSADNSGEKNATDPKANDDGVRRDATDPVEAASVRSDAEDKAANQEGDEVEEPDTSTTEGRLEADGYDPIESGAKYVVVSERTDGLNTRTLELKGVGEAAGESRMLEVGDVLEIADYDPGLV